MIPNLKVFINAIEEIDVAGGITHKVGILASLQDNAFAHEVIRQVFDDDITYGIHIEPTIHPDYARTISTEEAPVILEEYKSLTLSLQKRTLTGNDARLMAQSFLDTLEPVVAYWFTKFLNKEFARGVGPQTVGRVFPQYINPFTFQKCDDFLIVNPDIVKGYTVKKDHVREVNEHNRMAQGYIIQPKYDGYRGIYIDGKIRSSSGQDHFNTRHITNAIPLEEDIVYDGELMANDWNDTSSIVTTEKAHPFAHSLKYYVWAFIPLARWREGGDMKTEEDMRDRLYSKATQLGYINLGFGVYGSVDGPIRFVIGDRVDNTDDAVAIARNMFMAGYEGAILKNPDGFYQRWAISRNGVKRIYRSSDWLKIKFEDTADYRIKGVVWSKDMDKDYNRKYGDYMIESIILDVNGKEVMCGSMKYEDRVFYTQHNREAVGHLAEVRFQKPSEQFQTTALRYPSHKRYRGNL